jgi:hypothetical protein
MKAPFDPTHSLKFDLGRGRVAVDGSQARLVLPLDAVRQLCDSAGTEALRDFGRNLGTEVGRRVSNRLPSIKNATVQDVVEHLGGDLALMGLGSLSIERWGEATVFVVSDCGFGPASDQLLAAVLAGAVQRAMSRDMEAVVLSREDDRIRFLATSQSTAAKVNGWLADGMQWGEVLSTLHSGTS